jgi:two-component system LytT family response regulator/two-component system response regulator LytT
MAGPVPFKPPAGRSGTAIPTVLADDEALALDELAFLLREFPDIEIVGTARNGIEAVQCIEECEPDLVFLDVQMPGLDGLGVIHKLKADKAPMPAFVLCTAYEQYALEAFRLEALDYLLKPVDRDRLAQTVERVKRSLLEPEPAAPTMAVNAGAAPGPVARAKLLVKTNGRNLIVDASDLIYATIEDGLITVVTTAVEGQTNYKTIEELQSSLDPATFWRAHRGYVVNINHIREVIPWFKSSYQLRMDDKKGTEIPVSRVQTKRLRELFKL